MSEGEVVIVIDVSGSMGGVLIESVKRAAMHLLDQYADRDIRVLAFDDNLILFSPDSGHLKEELKTSKKANTRSFGLQRYAPIAS